VTNKVFGKDILDFGFFHFSSIFRPVLAKFCPFSKSVFLGKKRAENCLKNEKYQESKK
jgi:hypothetical protein